MEYQNTWCDHKPSITVSYTDVNFLEIGHWIWTNWEYVSGVSFLPYDNNVYDQAPFEAINRSEYDRMIGQMPSTIDWNNLSLYENMDMTTSSQELACHGGSCEVVDVTENIYVT